jgi:hypothetical protein
MFGTGANYLGFDRGESQLLGPFCGMRSLPDFLLPHIAQTTQSPCVAVFFLSCFRPAWHPRNLERSRNDEFLF